ncbi:glycosyltransferase family 2 protein [Aporhodopirellula aestuarii]|uniref:Glycosyltransferase n=1 Tax=Aporhodopirellula aestuarii TaxID=2950107 RepID=A0ABT0UE25_9BACT|nr:glycosyltransferase family 2 protein [Aporhodopirellula aestuarii]MCM2375149.1 glycosyltransferase [Aporhodopirellula aestuarii]
MDRVGVSCRPKAYASRLGMPRNHSIMSSSPQVSIGLPVRNGERFLVEALDCLVNQSYGDFELLISDNDSTDQTEAICREYASKDSRIRYHRQTKNVGAIGNFNYVFHHTKGKYFKWASSDDLCHPEFVSRCVDILETTPDVIWCHAKSDMVDSNGESWLDRLPRDDEEVELDEFGNRRWKGHPRVDLNHDRPSRRYAGVLLGTRWSVDSYGLFRRDALNKTRMLVDIYGSEKVLIGELSLIGKMHWIDELLFSQRIHAGASSYIDSANAQAEFISARNRKPFVSTRWSIFRAHYGAIAHAELPTMERLACHAVLARYLLQIGKWKRVVTTTLSGQSVGGGGKRIIENAAG